MAAAYRAKKELAEGTGTTAVIKTPSSTVVGDQLFFVLFVETESAVTISGLTVQQIKNGGFSYVVGRGLAPGAGEKEFKAEWGGASKYRVGSIVVYKEPNQTTPIAASAFEWGASSKTMTFPSVSPGVYEVLDVIIGVQGGIKTTATGYTTRTNRFPEYIADKALTGSGATGTTTAELTTAEAAAVFRFAIAPAPKTVEGKAALTASGSLTAQGTRERLGNSVLSATSALNAKGLREALGKAALGAASSLNAKGTRGTGGKAALSAVSSLIAGGLRTRFGKAALSAISALTADGSDIPPGGFGGAGLIKVGHYSVSSGSASTHSASKPSERKEGDLLLLFVVNTLIGSDVSVAGFTPVGARVEQTNGSVPFQSRCFWAIEEGAGAPTVSWDGTTQFCETIMLGLRFADDAAPIGAHAAAAAVEKLTRLRGPGVTVPEDQSCLVMFGAEFEEGAGQEEIDPLTEPERMTEGFHAGGFFAATIQDGVEAGPSGNVDVDYKAANWNAGWLIAISPEEAPPVPVNTVAPVLSGTPSPGDTLSVTEGTWEHYLGGAEEGIEYRWQVSSDGVTAWTDLLGPAAVEPTYAVLAQLAGWHIRCQVVTFNRGGGGEGLSNAFLVTGSATGEPILLWSARKREEFERVHPHDSNEPIIQEGEPGRISNVSDPLGSGRTVMQFACKDTDVFPLTPTENPRVEAVSPIWLNEGAEFWLSVKFLIPESFPTIPPEGWLALTQVTGLKFEGNSPWQLKITPNSLCWQRNQYHGYDLPWSVPLSGIKGQWVEIVMHQKFSTEGWVEMWVNGQQVTFFDNVEALTYNPSKISKTTRLEMPTRDESNEAALNFANITQYRKLGMFPTETLSIYHDHLEMGAVPGEPEPIQGNRLRVRENPPMRQYLTATTPGGKTYRWSDDESFADHVLEGLQDSDSVPGGFKELTGSLGRKPGVDYGDLQRGTRIEVWGAGQQKISEYRLERAPRTAGDKLVVNPAANGYQAALSDDESAAEIVIDADMTAWGEPSAQRRYEHATEKINVDGQVQLLPAGAPEGGSVPAISHAFAQINNNAFAEPDTAESWYHANGIELGELLLDFASVKGLGASWFDEVSTSIDGSTLLEELHNFAGTSAPEQSFPIAAGRFYLMLRDYLSISAAESGNWEAQWRNLKVLGRHGLTPYGTWPDIGFLASDVIAYAIQRWAPLLNFTTGPSGSIQPTTFPIPQLAFKEQTTVQEMVTKTLATEMLEWGVWCGQKGPTFYLNQRGEREGRKRWRARVRPAKLEETGPQMDKVYNGVLVSYQDVGGETRVVGPPGSGCRVTSERLLDTDPLNPANELGIRRWKKISIGVSTQIGATQAGEYFLAYSKEHDGSGTATLTGYVEDEAGIFWPYYCVHAGDLIQFIDSSDTSFRYIIEAQRSRQSRSVQIQLDLPPDSAQGLSERLNMALVESGLSQ